MGDHRLRRLTAVWFADIVGYTSLSSTNEDAALAVVEELQRLASAEVERRGGRVAKFLGDGVLAVFESTDAAVRAALALQIVFSSSVTVREAGCTLRIGVHVGEAVHSPEGDVYGDGINLAARIQSVAPAGQVVVSGDVWRQIRQRGDFRASPLGPTELRGVQDPIELWMLGEGAVPNRPAAPRWLPWVVSGVAATVLSLLVFHTASRSEAPAPAAIAFTIPAPESMVFLPAGIAVSPDGRRIAFVARDTAGRSQLWVRPLDSAIPRPLAGTEGASLPFWSPDGRDIGFFADGHLKRIADEGGIPQVLAVASDPFGGAWGSDGMIVFSNTHADGLRRISAAGLEERLITPYDPSAGDDSHAGPDFLPDGRRFLYRAFATVPERTGLFVGSVDSAERVRILTDPVPAAYAESADGVGHLLFLRDETLMAQPFDPDRLQLSGEPLALAQPVTFFSASGNGVLVHAAAGEAELTELTWFDRDGRRLGTIGEPTMQSYPELSPTGNQVAVHSEGDVWIRDDRDGSGRRLTFDPGDDMGAVWAPDGDWVVFWTGRDGPWNLYLKQASGAGESRPLIRDAYQKWPVDWSHDGRFLLYGQTDTATRWDLWVVVDPLGPSPRTAPYLRTAADEDYGQFSPDGRWIAYHSTEAGKYEIFVRPFFPDSLGAGDADPAARGGRWQVSTDGGYQPRWGPDGEELFFMWPPTVTSTPFDGFLMVAPVRKTTTGLQFDPPQPLFRVQASGYGRYDISPNGDRFLVNRLVGSRGADVASVVVGWTTRLGRRAGGPQPQ